MTNKEPAVSEKFNDDVRVEIVNPHNPDDPIVCYFSKALGECSKRIAAAGPQGLEFKKGSKYDQIEREDKKKFRLRENSKTVRFFQILFN